MLPYGGSANPGYRSGNNTIPANLETLPLNYDTTAAPLGLGFAVAFSSRMVLGNGADLALSAENTLKLKEHFIREYGLPKFTIGSGPSGGSMQVHFIAGAYPGLLDAIIAGVSYPDLLTTATDAMDCTLLYRYFPSAGLSVDAQAAITGYPQTATGNVCQTWAASLGSSWSASNLRFAAVIPSSAIYNAATNPTGVRGSVYDQNVNILGRDPATGFAQRTYDNVGVQYGLAALNEGKITVAQFLDLNRKIGGFDVDGNSVANRTEANPGALTAAYRSGLVSSGRNMTIPVMDLREWYDDRNNIHTKNRTFYMMARLQAANGTAANQVNWTNNGAPDGAFNAPKLTNQAFVPLNDWLERIAADTTADSGAQKVLRNKPPSLVDTCWSPAGEKIEEPATLEPGSKCNQIYPFYGEPRRVAGEGIARDILKCTLKPIDPADYKIAMTAAELTDVRSIFPAGVCDWTKPAQGKADIVPWQRY